MAGNKKSEEPQPMLKLKDRGKPLQKITIADMPVDLYKELKKRASRYNRKVTDYCRIVLEHAMEYKDDYKGPILRGYNDEVSISEKIHVPLIDKEFKENLVKWDPYGVRIQPRLVLSILKKHIEVRTW